MDTGCIIHYSHINFSNHLTKLSFDTHGTLLRCKNIRMQLGCDNLHAEQCEGVPHKFNENLKLYYHRECYQRFTYARTLLKRKIEKVTNNNAESKRASRLSIISENSVGLFPEYCMICHKTRVTINRQIQYPSKIVTHTAQEKLREAAKLKCDSQMLGEISGVCLIAKEFRKHEKCYRDYTRPVDDEKDKSNVLYEHGDYTEVCRIINNDIIGERKCVSLDTLLQVYGLISWPKQYRHKLRIRLLKTYGDKLLFLNAEQNAPQVVISKRCLETESIGNKLEFSDEFIVKKAATILRKTVLKRIQTAPDLPWPPTVKSLQSNEREPPELLKIFYQNLLKPENYHHQVTVKSGRLINSFCSDVMFSVSKEKFLTLKHSSLGLGLHSITGLKIPIEFLHKLGHSISYDQVCLIETAQAELVQHFHSLSLQLPLLPAQTHNDTSTECKVSTIFWWDNFDRNIETTSGAGSIHNTPGIAFQEISNQSISRNEEVSIPQSKCRSIKITNEAEIPYPRIHPKANPGLFVGPTLPEKTGTNDSDILLQLWKILRYRHSSNQQYPRFDGWIMSKFKKSDQNATVMTYLPPIQKPITDYGTIFEIFYTSRQLAKQSNMLYTHITFDLGAAIKAYQVLWNNPSIWSDIIIHLGDFHAMMTFFAVIGKVVNGSGFEEIIYQTDLCSPGSIAGVLKGKQYNRCWMVHEAFSEALERLFLEQYVPEMPLRLRMNDETQLSSEEIQFLKVYEQQRKSALDGGLGKTAQYWVNYLNMVDRQHKLHLAIKTNDYDLRLQMWDELLPLCFVTNRVHYARYGTYYVNQLKHLETTHPGARGEIEKVGLSVRRNEIGIGQAIDLAGEQTYMKNAKTSGGVTMFANSEETVKKWVMNRPFQSRFNEAIKELCDMTKTATHSKKCLRPTEIQKSNRMVAAVVEILRTQFINPFDPTLDPGNLYNIVSGAPASAIVCESLMDLERNGNSMKKEFEARITSGSEMTTSTFYSSLKRFKFQSLEDSNVKAVVTKNGKEVEIAYQRDIMGILVSQSYTSKTGVDIDKVLAYPLAPVSIPLCTSDGHIRKTAKSKLYDAAMKELAILDITTLPPTTETYFLDLVATIRTMSGTTGTIRQLAWKIVDMIPKQFKEYLPGL